MNDIDPEVQVIKEIMKLNNISEAEEVLVFQLSAVVQAMGWGKMLTAKIMQTLVDIIEASKDFKPIK